MNKIKNQDQQLEYSYNRKLLMLLAGAMIIINVIPVWLVTHFPSQNGPLYLLVIKMFKEYSNPAYNYADYYEYFFLLIPNLVFHALVYFLSFLMPVLIAFKVMISLNLILLPLSVFYLINAIDSRKLIYGFGIFAFTYNYYLFKGYDSFYFSLTLAFFAIGFFITYYQSFKTKHLVALALFLCLIYLSHVFAFLMVIGIVLLYIIARIRDAKIFFKFLLTCIPGLILFLQFFIFAVSKSDSLVGGEGNQLIRYQDPYRMLKTFLRMSNYSFSDLTVYIFWIFLFFLFYQAAKKLWQERDRLTQSTSLKEGLLSFVYNEPAFFILTILVIGFFVAPFEIAGWPKFNMRVLPFVFVFLLISVNPLLNRRINNLLLTTIIIISVSINAIMISYIFQINKEMNNYLSGISYVKNNKLILPISISDYKVGRIRPLHWAFNYYNFYKGGATGRSLAYVTGRAPVRYKKSAAELFPRFEPEQPAKADVQRIGEVYDYVLFWGIDEEIFNHFKKNGFELIHHREKLSLFVNHRKLSTVGMD